jgi:hypothetical protein
MKRDMMIATVEKLRAYIIRNTRFYQRKYKRFDPRGRAAVKELEEHNSKVFEEEMKAYTIKDGKFYPRIYATLEELREYITNTGRCISVEELEADKTTPLLKYLLREIFNKYNGRRGKWRGRKGKGEGERGRGKGRENGEGNGEGRGKRKVRG